MCSRGGPSPARSAGVADKAHHLGPRRRRGRDPVPRAGHGASQAGRNSPATAWCGGPGTRGIYSRPLAPPREERPGHHRDPRSNHVVRRYASLLPPRTPTPSTGCRAACGSRPGTRVNYPGPHPQAHRVGRRQGGQAQAPVRPAPHTPRPAAGHRRPGRRPEGRIDRLPQPAQPRRHHPPHHRAPGRPRPPGQGQDRPAPASPGPPASCPTSARASGSGEPPRPPPITRAVPREAPKKFRGHLDMRHPGRRRTGGPSDAGLARQRPARFIALVLATGLIPRRSPVRRPPRPFPPHDGKGRGIHCRRSGAPAPLSGSWSSPRTSRWCRCTWRSSARRPGPGSRTRRWPPPPW